MLLALTHILQLFHRLLCPVVECYSPVINPVALESVFPFHQNNSTQSYQLFCTAGTSVPVTTIDIADISEERRRFPADESNSMPAHKLMGPALLNFLASAESGLGKNANALSSRTAVLLWLFAVY